MAQTKHTLECCTTLANETFPASGASCTARDAAIYLAHTERGETLRALAQATGTHPSTVMRAVRRVEARRDDPLFDSMFKDLKQRAGQPEGAPPPANDNQAPGPVPPGSPRSSLERPELERQARRYLRRLSEPGSFLLLSPGAIKGGIFCKANEYRKPIAMLLVKLAVDFAREGWIRVARRGVGTVRYCITGDGRSFLKRLLAEDAIKRQPSSGFAEATSPFLAQHQISGERTIMDPETGKPLALKINQGEDPLGWLARRKGPDGRPFLTADEIEAGERLRTDFEIAQMGASVAQDWRKFLTPGDRYSGSPVRRGPGEGPVAARDRVASAMLHLGPGLADAALRVCCFLEGLEACERRMGWSMRSGKVVLKIALQRLHGHYVLPPARQ